MRLQFNKIGYEMYDKEQSRRVPAVRAKPGNPGYGFRRARWRETSIPGEDRKICESILKSIGVNAERIDRIKKRVNDFKIEWDTVRRPSRPAGPGRPRGHKRSSGDFDAKEPLPALVVPQQQAAPAKKSKKAPLTKGSKVCGSPPAEAAASGDASDGHPAYVVSSRGYGFDCSSDEHYDDQTMGRAWEVSVEGGCEQQQQQHDEECDGVALRSEEETRITNESLRSLNMSLIYEREQLIVQIKYTEKEMAEIQADFDSILAHTPGGVDGDIGCAFSIMARRIVVREGPDATQGDEFLNPGARRLLTQAFDKFEGLSRPQKRPNHHHHGNNNHDVFAELNEAPLSCADLRDLLDTMSATSRVDNAMLFDAIKEEKRQVAHRQHESWQRPACAVKEEVHTDASQGVKHEQVNSMLMDDGCCDLGSYEYLFNMSGTATAF